MAFNPDHLIFRQPIVDRNREVAFTQLTSNSTEYDVVMPFMLRLANIQIPQAVYFLPMAWVQDEVLFKKLAKDMVLVTPAAASTAPIAERAREAGYRVAITLEQGDARQSGGDFTIVALGAAVTPSTDTVYIDINTPADEAKAKSSLAMYFAGRHFLSESAPVAGGKRINPSHALILELMSAVQQEAEPKAIEALIKRDVTLSFKLLRYINSPWFGLSSQVESVRHALSIIGYQQLLKWLTLLAITAGQDASPVLTQTAMVRAKLMELVGAKMLDKREADNLFVTGMLSLLDRIMGVPMADILQHVNLPPAITEALTQGDGRYHRFLTLALACEGNALPEDTLLDDIDVKAVNLAHLDAIEWATQAGNTALS